MFRTVVLLEDEPPRNIKSLVTSSMNQFMFPDLFL